MSTALSTPPKANVGELMNRVGDSTLSFGARLSSVGDVMRASQKQMLAALPRHVTPDRMIRVAMNCIRKNPKLLDCKPVSLFSAITEAATYGWELGGVLGHAYLVPFRDDCTLIPGYKGLIDLCRRSGQVSTISLEVVHQGDTFSYSLGDDPHIKHVPNNDRDVARDAKPIIYVYAVVKLRDGGIQRSVWSAEKVNAHKEKYSQGWRRAEGKSKDSPWHTAWETMAKKTVIRDMIQRGLVPLSAEYSQLVERTTVVDDEGEPIAGMDLIPDRSEGVDDLRTIDDQSQGAADDGGSQLNPLEGIAEQFLSAETRADAKRIYDNLCGPDAVVDLTDEQRKLVTGWFEDACKRIDPPKGKKQGALV